MKTVYGFVREHPGGTPLENVDVTIRDAVDGSPVPVGGMQQSSQNPTITGVDGDFIWTTELSPGPLRVEADINAGVEVKVRVGSEVMQAGDIFISDIPSMLQIFSVGVYKDVGDEFETSAITGQRAIRVNPGAANMLGRLLQTETNREIAISANPSLPTRLDLVVLEQHVGGDYIGKQNIAVVEGTVDNTEPSTNSDPNVLQLPIYQVKILLNGTTVTVSDKRLYSGPTALSEDTVGLPQLKQEVLDYIAAQFPGFTVLDNDVSVLETTKKLNFKTGFTVTQVGDDQIDLDVAEIDPVVQTTGKYYKDTNFGASGLSGTSLRNLGSASVQVPAGTWMCFTLLTLSIVGGGGTGYTRFKIAGNGAPSGSGQSTRAYLTGTSDVRQVVLSARHVITVTGVTTLTSTAQVIHESGTQAQVLDGHVSIMVV